MSSKPASSPNRFTFQKEGYIKRCKEKGKEPNPDYINMYKTWREQDTENLKDPDWQQNNLEYDLRSTEWICDKAKNSESYAQNLYAALCNNEFLKLEVVPILKNETWSCSWRHAGGIVADMLKKGDYIDWYCSGIRGLNSDYDPNGKITFEEWQTHTKYVSEGNVTDEIKEDFKKLGWTVVETTQDV
jgi:hypothetical protein